MRPLQRSGLALALLCLTAGAQIRGRFVAGGMAPPEPALVSVRCPGFAPWTGYTDKRGEFAAALAEASGDAGPGATGGAGTGGCRVEASARGFQGAVIDVLDSETAGLVLSLKRLGSSGTVPYGDVEIPAAARKLFDKAAREIARKNWGAAEADLRKRR